MKTKFTLDELYEAYSEAVVEEFNEEYNIDKVEARILVDERIKSSFYKNISKYDHLEPSEVARIIYEIIQK